MFLTLSLLVCFACVWILSLFFFFSGKGIRKKGRKKSFYFIFGDNPKRKERKFRVPLCCEVREWERAKKEWLYLYLQGCVCLWPLLLLLSLLLLLLLVLHQTFLPNPWKPFTLQAPISVSTLPLPLHLLHSLILNTHVLENTNDLSPHQRYLILLCVCRWILSVWLC